MKLVNKLPQMSGNPELPREVRSEASRPLQSEEAVTARSEAEGSGTT